MKLQFDIKGITNEISDNLIKGKQVTKEALCAMIENFEKLPMEDKIKLIGNISVVSSDSNLNMNNVKVGMIVEEVDNNEPGMIIKVNQKSVHVIRRNGLISVSPGLLKTSEKTLTELLIHFGDSARDTLYSPGVFVKVLIQNKWENGVTISSLSKKSKIFLIDKGTVCTVTESQLYNENLIKLIKDKVK